MILTYGTSFHECSRNLISSPLRVLKARFSIVNLVASLQLGGFFHGNEDHVGCSFIRVKKLNMIYGFKRMVWSIRSNADGRGFDPPSSSDDRRTRLLKTFQTLKIWLNDRIRNLRKDLPKKFIFFLVGFYCATAFATVIGQTGDWDILSAALAVGIVEGIGALMYKSSVPFLDKTKNLIVMFNYWKAGLTLGLFLDSFKY